MVKVLHTKPLIDVGLYLGSLRNRDDSPCKDCASSYTEHQSEIKAETGYKEEYTLQAID